MIDTSNLDNLISSFRSITEQRSITPDSLGYILQQISDKLSTAAAGSAREIDFPPIQIFAKDTNLMISGHEKYIEKGYVPYLFRNTVKSNRYKVNGVRVNRSEKRGWNLMGGEGVVKIEGNFISFCSEEHKDWHQINPLVASYSDSPEQLVLPHYTNGIPEDAFVTWGKNRVCINNPNYKALPRMLKFRFAIAFAAERKNKDKTLRFKDLASNLAVFTVTRDGSGNWAWSYDR